MKNALYTLAILFFANTIFAQGKVEITVSKVIVDGGNIRVALYNTEDSFLKKPFKVDMVKSTSEKVKLVFSNLPAGKYAISLYQDENKNKELDMGVFGPKEPYGFSNNAKGSFGPAKFKDAKFEVTNDNEAKQNIVLD